jgi:PAS domain S-box-containing protein
MSRKLEKPVASWISPRERALFLYAIATLSTFLALAVSLSVPAAHDSPVFMPFLVVTALIAWFGDLKSGLYTLGLTLFEIVYFIVPPTHSISIAERGDVVHLTYYGAIGVVAVVAATRLRKAKRKVAKLVQDQQSLREEAERRAQELSAVLAALPVGVFISDARGKLIQTNPAIDRIWGKPVPLVGPERYEAYRGRFVKDGRRLTANDWALARALRTGQSIVGEEIEIEAFDGAHRTILNSAQPVRNSDGQTIGGVAVNVDITELKQAEKALRESEERYRRLVEMSPDAIMVHRNYRIEFVNPAAMKLLGAENAGQIIGKSLFDVFHPDYHQLIRDRIAALGVRQTTPLIEQKLVRLDGGFVDIAVTASVFSDENGPAIQVIMHDITERKREEEHRQRLHKTLTALNNSSQALLRATSESALLERICQIVTEDCGHALVWIGFADNDEHKSVRPVAHAGFEEGYLETLHLTWADNERGRGPTGTAIRTGEPVLCRDMFSNAHFAPWRQEALKRGYASSVAVPLLSEGKAFGVLTVYSMERDSFCEDEVKLLKELAADLAYGISAMRLRAAHDQAEEALRESEEKFRTFISRAADAVFVHDVTGKFLDVNQRACESLGYSRDELLRMQVSDIVTGLDMTVEEVAWAQCEPGQAFTSVATQKRKNGTTFPVEVRVGSFEIRGQRLYLGLARDISERKRAESALIRAEKLASVGRMAATIAHEINNPLAAITNSLYLAKNNIDNPEALRRFLEMADEELRRVSHISRQALGLYRESSTPTRISVGDLMDSVLELQKNRVRAQRVTVEREFDPAAEVSGIVGELRQVFSNLLANSLDAVSAGGTIKLRVSSQRSVATADRVVRITVADNGKGISADALPRIFDPFFTTKDVFGTGLGLWVSKRIIDDHHGSISVRSSTRKQHTGTVVRITLPAAAAHVQQAAGSA